MKRCILLSLLVLSLCILASCDKNSVDVHKLEGKWWQVERVVDIDEITNWFFRVGRRFFLENGNGLYREGDSVEFHNDQWFHYVYDNDTIYLGSEGTSYECKIIKNTNSALVLDLDDGNYRWTVYFKAL